MTSAATVPTPDQLARFSGKVDGAKALYSCLSTYSSEITVLQAADLAGNYKASVRAASTANVANLASCAVAQDGVTLVQNDRILLKDQSTGSQNGIYTVGAVSGGNAPLTRATDADGSSEVKAGMVVFVSEGTTNGNQWFFLTTNDPVVVGTTALVFALIPQTSDITSLTTRVSTAESTEASTTTSLTTRVSTSESTETSTTASLTTRVSTEESTRASADTSVTTRINADYVPISLFDFREVDGGGDVGNAAANGGILASDTTPILRADAAESQEISWAAGNTDPIGCQFVLPSNFNGAALATVDLWVYTDNGGGGGIDAATFTVETSWDGGALVADTATDGTPATTIHKITATIAAADIPDTASFVSMYLTPAAHAADPVQLVAARVNFAVS